MGWAYMLGSSRRQSVERTDQIQGARRHFGMRLSPPTPTLKRLAPHNQEFAAVA